MAAVAFPSEEEIERDVALSREVGLLVWGDKWEEAKAVCRPNGDVGGLRSSLHFAEVCYLIAAASSVPEDVTAAREALALTRSIANSFAEESTLAWGFRSLSELVLGVDEDGAPPPPAALTKLYRLDCSIALAQVAFMESVLYFLEKAYPSGALRLRSSWKGFHFCEEQLEILRSDPECGTLSPALTTLLEETEANILFGTGIYNYFFSLIPPSVKWLVEIISFEADAEQGLLSLQRCAASGMSRAPLANVTLCMALGFTRDEEERAVEIADTLCKTHPGSFSLFCAGYIYRKVGRMEEAEAAFRFASEHAPVLQTRLNSMRELARCHLGMRRYNEAIPLCTKFLDESTADAWKAWCTFQLAIAHESMGNANETHACMKSILTLRADAGQSFLTFARTRAEQYMESNAGKTTPEIPLPTLAFAQIYFARDCHQYESGLGIACTALAMLRATSNNGSNGRPDDIAPLLYMKGSMLRGMKQYDEAIEAFEGVEEMDTSIVRERMAVPWALYEMAECLLALGDLDMAQKCVGRADDVKGDYEFKKMLSSRLKRTRQAIKRAHEADVMDSTGKNA